MPTCESLSKLSLWLLIFPFRTKGKKKSPKPLLRVQAHLAICTQFYLNWPKALDLGEGLGLEDQRKETHLWDNKGVIFHIERRCFKASTLELPTLLSLTLHQLHCWFIIDLFIHSFILRREIRPTLGSNLTKGRTQVWILPSSLCVFYLSLVSNLCVIFLNAVSRFCP